MKWKSCYVIPCFLESNPIWHRPIKLTLPVIWSLPISWLDLLSHDPQCVPVWSSHALPLREAHCWFLWQECTFLGLVGWLPLKVHSLLQCYFLRDLPWPIYVSTSTILNPQNPVIHFIALTIIWMLFIYYLLYWRWWDTKVNVHVYY